MLPKDHFGLVRWRLWRAPGCRNGGLGAAGPGRAGTPGRVWLEEEEGAVLWPPRLPQPAPTARRAPGALQGFSAQRPCKTAHIQLQWGLVRLNDKRHLAEVGGGHPAPGAGGTEGGEACFLGTMLFLLESQNVFWKAADSCGNTGLLCFGSLWLSLPCWWRCRS